MKTQHGGKRYGIFSGALWGLDTVVLAIALAMTPFLDFGQSALAGAVLHDVACAVILLVYMAIRGRLKDTWKGLRTRPGMSVVVAALLGGPIGMSGYLIAIDNIGPGLTAIISTFYPALGTLLAFALLKERMAPRQIIALLVALGAIVATGWSATAEPIEGGNALLGVAGALACVIGWGPRPCSSRGACATRPWITRWHSRSARRHRPWSTSSSLLPSRVSSASRCTHWPTCRRAWWRWRGWRERPRTCSTTRPCRRSARREAWL